MKPIIHSVVVLVQVVMLSCYSYAGGSAHSTDTLNIDLEGRGLYQEAAVAIYSGKTVILEAPSTGWLTGMKDHHLALLKEIDLNNLPELAALLTEGLHHTTVPTEISLEYFSSTGKAIKTVLPVTNIRANSGNMLYELAEPVDLPSEMEKTSLLFKTWPVPTEQATVLALGGRGPTKAVCCDCSGKCAALWILLGYCKSCMTALGGENCCSECHKPAAPGGSCK